MDITTLIKTLPFLAPLAAIFMFWGQIQTVLHKIFNLFIVEIDLQQASCEAVCHFLVKNTKSLSFGFNSYLGCREYLKPLKKEGIYIIKKIEGQPSLFWYKGNFIYMCPTNGEDKKTREYFNKRMKLFVIRGTLDPDKFVEMALDEYNEFYSKYSARFFINMIVGMGNKTILASELNNMTAPPTNNYDFYFNKIIKYKIEDIGYGIKNKENIPYVFSKDSNILLNDVKKWKESEKWYREKGILWRRGSLLAGVPSSGKSSAVRAVAQTLDLPIYIYDLASLSNLEFTNEWKKMLTSIPCIALFEDIDAVFEGRKNIVGENGGGLSFDCLLNAISGALPSEGVYVVVTTNHMEKLDPALGIPDNDGKSSRNGRLDNMIMMNYLSSDCKIKIVNKLLKDTNVNKDYFINLPGNMTAGRFIELCGQAALDEHWKINS